MQGIERSILTELVFLYGEAEAGEVAEKIDLLIRKYRKRIPGCNYRPTHQDVVLIIYADQVVRPGEAPLVTLRKFLKEEMQGLINSVHLLPFYPSSSDDGFSVIDYKEVAPGLGNWDDIATLAQDYRLMFDAVCNHVSQYHFWFRAMLAGDKKYATYFYEVDPETDLHRVVRPRTTPLLHPFTDVYGNKHHIWTTFSRDQVDLNYRSSELLLEILETLLFYVWRGAKLLRLDAVAFLWKEAGTESIHLPQTHALIRLMRKVLHEVSSDVLLVTETNVPHEENISYFGGLEPEADMVYNFALPPLLAYAVQSGDVQILTQWAQKRMKARKGACFFNFTASHDGCGLRPVRGLLPPEAIDALTETVEKRGGYVSYRTLPDGNREAYELNMSYIDIISDPSDPISLRLKKMLLTQAVMLALPGIPGIYFHSLVGSTSDFDAVMKTGKLRAINREKCNVDRLCKMLHETGSLRAEIFSGMKKLLRIRQEEPLFDPYGESAYFSLEDAVFGIRRFDEESGTSLLALHNFSNRTIICNISNFLSFGGYDLIAERRVENGMITLDAYAIAWIKYEEDDT